MSYPDPHSHYSHHYPRQRQVSQRQANQRQANQRQISHQQASHQQALSRQGDMAAQSGSVLPPHGRGPSPASTRRRSPQRETEQPQRRNKVRRKPRSRGALLASGGMLALAALVVVPKSASENPTTASVVCQETVQSQSVLSRAELSELLAVPERSSKDAVQQVIEAPYCTLNSVEVREGAIAEREAYPLAFDPQTWLIVLYEEGEYAGYDFSFRRE